MEVVIGASAFIGGALLAALIVWLRLNAQLAAMRERAASRQQRIDDQHEQWQRLRQDAAQHVRESRAQLSRLEERRQDAEVRAATLETELRTREKQFDEQRRLLDEAERKLATTFERIGSRALDANNERFIELAHNTLSTYMNEARGDVDQRRRAVEQLVQPIRDLLEQQNAAVVDLEAHRTAAYRGLEEQIQSLESETQRLITAMRRPEGRGRWGAMQLRNVVELAGMSDHCDFFTPNEEAAGDDEQDDGPRPDMLVRLPGGGSIAIDANVALDAYLESLQPDADRRAALARHGQQLEAHVEALANRARRSQAEHSPRLTVLFLPLESALPAALEHRPDLHARAMRQQVLIATPMLLVALLRSIAIGWQEESVREHAQQVAGLGRELHDRLSRYVAQVDGVGRAIDEATERYNEALGSLERDVLPTARRLGELESAVQPRSSEIDDAPSDAHMPEHPHSRHDHHAPPRRNSTSRAGRDDADGDDIAAPEPLTQRARDVTAAELRSLTDESG